MENEGIMALPEGQPNAKEQPLPAITSGDSYDAATTALSRVNPEQLTAYKQVIRKEIESLQLSPSDLETMLEIVEYLSQNPAKYEETLKQLIDQDYVEAGDLPDQYDAVFLGAMLAVLNEVKLSQAELAQAPMQMEPTMEGMPPAAMAKGGLADVAQYLASQGRNNDTMLAHITPVEAQLLQSMGGSGTINPRTGLREFGFFSFIKKAFKAVVGAVKSVLKNPIVRIVATVALATVLGPSGYALMSSSAAAATAAGATTLAAGGNLKDALIASATSYFGAGGTIGGVNPASAIASRVGQYLPGGATGAVAGGVGAGLTGAGIGMLAGMKPADALRMGAMQGLTTGATQAFQNWRAGSQPAQGQPTPEQPAQGQPAPEQVAAPEAAAPTPTQAAEQVSAGAPGPIGTAQQVGPLVSPTATPSQLAPSGMRYDPFTGQYKPSTFGAMASGSVQQAANLPASTFTSRLGQFFRSPSMDTATNAFLVNPNAAPGTLMRYAPAALTTVGIGALTGGFKEEPVNEAPLYDRTRTGTNYIKEHPELFGGTLGRVEGMPAPYNPYIPTPAYSTLPTTTPRIPTPPTVMPRGATAQPYGIVQPYNVTGLYGVPELSAPVQQPVYAAGGGFLSAPPKPNDDPLYPTETIRNIREQAGIEATAPYAPDDFKAAVSRMNDGDKYAELNGWNGRVNGEYARDLQKQWDTSPVPGWVRNVLAMPLNKAAGGHMTKFPRKTGPINGPGTGTSDSIPAMLSDGEFVFTAKAVRNAGGGSRRKGAKRMYALMKKLEGGSVEG